MQLLERDVRYSGDGSRQQPRPKRLTLEQKTRDFLDKARRPLHDGYCGRRREAKVIDQRVNQRGPFRFKEDSRALLRLVTIISSHLGQT